MFTECHRDMKMFLCVVMNQTSHKQTTRSSFGKGAASAVPIDATNDGGL